MPKARSQPVIWLLLNKGLTPKQITELGYAKRTVYNYNAFWPYVKTEFKEKMRKLKEIKQLKKLRERRGVKVIK